MLYESPHRLLKTLEQLMQFCGSDRKCSVSRELTKKFEQTVRGTLEEVRKYFSENEIRGEFVLVVAAK